MIKITIDKAGKYRFAVYAKNGNELYHSVKGYGTVAEIDAIIAILRSGEYYSEIETANVAVRGHALYFTLYSLAGVKIAVSNVYKSENHRNTHNQVRISVNKTLTNLGKYLDKVVVIC